MWELDNEPDLWWETHHEIHPGCVDWDTLTEHSVEVAAAAKDADPTAQVAGPAMSTIIDMIGPRWEQDWDPGRCNPSNELEDPSPERTAHGGDRSFVEWYVDRMEQASDGGPRLLDVLDVHHYPAEPGVVDSAAGDATVQAARLSSVRALWDPTAIDTTWLGGPDGVYPNTALQVIPRLKEWAARFPGTKTGITEYSFGGFDTVNGALAQADALGVFAREGLDVAVLWPTEDLNLTTELANSFAIYRNYDGLHSKFGDTFVRSYSGAPNQSGQGQLAVYSAKRSDGALTTVVINKTAQPLTSNLTVERLPGGAPGQGVRVHRREHRGEAGRAGGRDRVGQPHLRGQQHHAPRDAGGLGAPHDPHGRRDHPALPGDRGPRQPQHGQGHPAGRHHRSADRRPDDHLHRRDGAAVHGHHRRQRRGLLPQLPHPGDRPDPLEPRVHGVLRRQPGVGPVHGQGEPDPTRSARPLGGPAPDRTLRTMAVTGTGSCPGARVGRGHHLPRGDLT